MNAVFADLNRGTDVTKGLRKVDKSEMTHKNPELRGSSAVPASTGAAHKKPVKPTKPAALAGKKPSKFVLEGTKWIIVGLSLLFSLITLTEYTVDQEHQENESSLVVENTEISHVVNLFGCKNTTVQVKGKINAINMSKYSVIYGTLGRSLLRVVQSTAIRRLSW